MFEQSEREAAKAGADLEDPMMRLDARRGRESVGEVLREAVARDRTQRVVVAGFVELALAGRV